MILAFLIVVGLCLGSFVNALVWRVHEQASLKDGKHHKELSIMTGRSMCPDCHHELSVFDLIPVFSWISLRGKCRYCHKPISAQYPLVESLVSALFALSYIFWPVNFDTNQKISFVIWLLIIVGLTALSIYDLRWKLLPNRLIYPVSILALIWAALILIASADPIKAILNIVLAMLVGGGIFYVLFQVSKGKWIGGGDVRLGWLLGLIAATPARSVLLLFIASLSGCMISIPLMMTSRLKRNSTIPFGPFLIIASVIVQLFGHAILAWYQRKFFPYSY